MLYKNDVIFELARFPKEIEAIEKHFHNKFPVKITYPPERIVKSKLPHNRLPDKPNSISFDYKAVVKTPTGTETWRYVENIITDAKGNKKYIPKKFMYDGVVWLDRNDIEKIYFLLRKSEYCVGGDNFGGIPKFVFEDLVSEAEKKAEKKKIQARVNKFIWDEEYRLAEDKIRAVAKAYQITGVDELKDNQVRIVVENKVFATPEGPDEFFLMINDDEQIKARNAITKAMEMKLLYHDDAKQKWYWKTADGKSVFVTSTPPTKTPNVAIYDHYLGNNAFRDDLQAALITKNPKAGKAKKEEPEVVLDEKEE